MLSLPISFPTHTCTHVPTHTLCLKSFQVAQYWRSCVFFNHSSACLSTFFTAVSGSLSNMLSFQQNSINSLNHHKRVTQCNRTTDLRETVSWDQHTTAPLPTPASHGVWKWLKQSPSPRFLVLWLNNSEEFFTALASREKWASQSVFHEQPCSRRQGM